GDCRAALIPLHMPDAAPNGKMAAASAPKVARLVWMSKDHKASSPDEYKRITELGGFVNDGRVEGLEPSRTLGDFDVKMKVKKGVISIVPEVRCQEVSDGTSPGQAILVCATDGVWDVISGQDVCDLIHARKDIVRLQLALSGEVPAGTSQPLRDFAEDLVQFAVARGSRDDCTAVAALIDVRSPGKRGSGGVSFPGAGAGSASRSAPSVLPPMSSSGRAAHSK
ncbi:unnamed protein product, partial [Prorocentrum cordatum]